MKTILIIEDDRELNRGLCVALEKVGYATASAFDLETARQCMQRTPALVLLDVNLPDGSGLDFLAELKAQNSKLPVIMLTSNDTDIDIVKGLEQGADDYITKPFSLAVLRARVAVQLRNAAKTKDVTGETSCYVDIDEKAQIFGRFYRSEKVRNVEGVGVGLYLSREILSKEGGYIKVSSDGSNIAGITRESESGSARFDIFLPNMSLGLTNFTAEWQ